MRESENHLIKDLKKGAHIHLMGICGTAMGSLAGLLKEMGYKVTGSDVNVYPPMSTQLDKLGIEIKKGFVKENLTPVPNFVIVGNVMTRNMEEVVALMESKIPFTSLPKALGELFLKDRNTIVCCGTHGKTTTTSMAAWALECLEQRPGYLIGGVPGNFDYSFSARKSDWFVIEGDEYDTAFFDKVPKFKHYYPKNAILTGIEFDHIDIYDSIDDVLKAFEILIDKIPHDGLLVYNGDDLNIKKLLDKKKPDYWKLSYGESEGLHSRLLEEEILEQGTRVVYKIGDREFEFVGNWFGTYNSLNFLSQMTVLDFNGLDLEKVMESAATYKGVARRQQQIYHSPNLVVYEDFAHHPTAVKLTLESFKKRFPEKNLIAVFEPRSATSRKDVFQKDYIESFAKADVAILAPVTKKSEMDLFSSDKLCSDLKEKSVKALTPKTVSEIPNVVKSELKGNDVVVFMSNGGFEGVHLDFVKGL
jgi:UDP-N-acetylmuramate: L-alanyl-gamma-D-glutamyl-meso-diaminopimelate ligase